MITRVDVDEGTVGGVKHRGLTDEWGEAVRAEEPPKKWTLRRRQFRRVHIWVVWAPDETRGTGFGSFAGAVAYLDVCLEW